MPSLRKVFDVRPGERAVVLLGAAYMAAVVSSFLLAKPIRNALFLTQYGAYNLVYVSAGVPVALTLIVPAYGWLADYDLDPATVEKLLEQKKLKWAFEQFGVTKVIGFETELVEKIVEMTGVEAF